MVDRIRIQDDLDRLENWAKSSKGGPFVEIFSAQGKNPGAKWKIFGSPSVVGKEFDKEVKGFVFVLEGSSQTNKMQLPKEIKQTLGLIQQFLVLQIYVPLGQDFSTELLIADLGNIKRRLYLSTVHKELSVTPLHAKIPLFMIKRKIWCNLCIDLVAFTSEIFKGAVFQSLDGIIVSANCKLRKIFTLKSKPLDAADEDVDGPTDTIPRACQLNSDVPQITQLLNMSKLRLLDQKCSSRPFTSTESVTHITNRGSTTARNTKSQDVSHIAFGSKVLGPPPPSGRRFGTRASGEVTKSGTIRTNRSCQPSALEKGRDPVKDSGGFEQSSSPSIEAVVQGNKENLHRTAQTSLDKVVQTAATESVPKMATAKRQPTLVAAMLGRETYFGSHGGEDDSYSEGVQEASDLQTRHFISRSSEPVITKEIPLKMTSVSPEHWKNKGYFMHSSDKDSPPKPENVVAMTEKADNGQRSFSPAFCLCPSRSISKPFKGTSDDAGISSYPLRTSISRKSLKEIPSDNSNREMQSHEYNWRNYQPDSLSASELQMLASMKRQQNEELENSGPSHGLSASQIDNCNISISASSDDTTTWNSCLPAPVNQGCHYQKEMNPLSHSNPRDWLNVFSPPIIPPSQQLEGHAEVAANLTPQGEDDVAEEDEVLTLLYDPCLNYYFDPETGKYYELA
ncbi:protein CFAP20DC [Sphaerodactylus townsendi]|nr:protein CFAP20DC [Sphaerodactylus townsendi]